MPSFWPGNRSLITLVVLAGVTAAISGGLAAASATPDEQAANVQHLFEAGSYDAVVQAVAADRQKGVDPPESTYLAAQALRRLEQPERAAEEFARLRSSRQAAWKLLGESGAALVEGNSAGAVDAAQKATEADGDLPWAHYQLGLAASRQSDFAMAARALARAVELKPDLAYGHYYAALAYQRQKQLSKAAEHFDAFLHLAPKAPERQAVLAIMRTLK